MLTGSMASSLFGEPRLSHDIDIIVQISPQEALTLSSSFLPPRYYLDDKESIEEMIRQEDYVRLPLLERRKNDRKDVQPEIKIFPKGFMGNPLF